ncbi:MAG: DUF1569 domain-containing protein [Ferruginibacter sp.]
MQSLFDTAAYNEVTNRMNKLSAQSAAQWGRMNVSQMLAHCKVAFMVPLSEKKLSRMFVGRIIGPLIKSKLYNESPWKQNLPTAPNFIIKDERNFEQEKKELLELINKFHKAGTTGISKYPHPFFGKFTPEQWGMSMYKHLDHHLRQFAV